MHVTLYSKAHDYLALYIALEPQEYAQEIDKSTVLRAALAAPA